MLTPIINSKGLKNMLLTTNHLQQITEKKKKTNNCIKYIKRIIVHKCFYFFKHCF